MFERIWNFNGSLGGNISCSMNANDLGDLRCMSTSDPIVVHGILKLEEMFTWDFVELVESLLLKT